MPTNAPLAEFVTDEGVSFQVVKENSSNHKDPRHPARLDRYNGSEWKEVDRWDIQVPTETNFVEEKSDSEIIAEAKERINTKARFDTDGVVVETDERS